MKGKEKKKKKSLGGLKKGKIKKLWTYIFASYLK
jgi:hypothetical protein